MEKESNVDLGDINTSIRKMEAAALILTRLSPDDFIMCDWGDVFHDVGEIVKTECALIRKNIEGGEP